MKRYVIIIYVLTVLVIGACSKEGTGENTSATGQGGSLARFTVNGNYLYVVDGMDLRTYNISEPRETKSEGGVLVGPAVETIFPFGGKLFVGSRDGMFIYSLEDPAHPELLGSATHMRSCDPVVANDTASFVTLQAGAPCGVAPEGLYVYDIKNVQQPVPQSYLYMQTPKGIGLKDTVLFVCQEQNGLTMVNVSNPLQPQVMNNISDDNYQDVIVYGDLLICYTTTGLSLYNTADLNHLVKAGNTKY